MSPPNFPLNWPGSAACGRKPLVQNVNQTVRFIEVLTQHRHPSLLMSQHGTAARGMSDLLLGGVHIV